MTESQPAPSLLSGRTAWARSLETPLRQFLRTETGSALVLATATLAALVWANISVSSYDKVWGTQLSVLIGGAGVTTSVHEFVNSGLMALFFLVVGLEARREFDVGELRVRSRLALPVAVSAGREEPWARMTLALAGYAVILFAVDILGRMNSWAPGLGWLFIDAGLVVADVAAYRYVSRPKSS